MTTTLSPLPILSFRDNNGNALVNGQLFTYQAGTQTPAPTYTDSTGSFQNPNPIILNARGEAQVWIPPNTALKYVLKDSFGNTLWTVDQIVNSQLLTLYGGVDSGTANAYVLNFVANFTAYTDGIIVYWIPSNTNTGASTININGLGVIALVNQDGSALRAGQIAPNLVASLLIKGGQALLLSGAVAQQVLAVAGGQSAPSISFLGDPLTGFYFTAAGQIGMSLGGAPTVIATGLVSFTLSGVTSPPNFNVRYYTNGYLVVLRFPQVNATSNSTSFTAFSTAPVNIQPPTNIRQWVMMAAMEDNTAGIYAQTAYLENTGPSSLTFTFLKNGSATGWTASGTKGIADGSTSVNAITVAYLLI
jgi:hypothetical protein